MSNVIRNFKGTVTIYNNFIVEQYFNNFAYKYFMNFLV